MFPATAEMPPHLRKREMRKDGSTSRPDYNDLFHLDEEDATVDVTPTTTETRLRVGVDIGTTNIRVAYTMAKVISDDSDNLLDNIPHDPHHVVDFDADNYSHMIPNACGYTVNPRTKEGRIHIGKDLTLLLLIGEVRADEVVMQLKLRLSDSSTMTEGMRAAAREVQTTIDRLQPMQDRDTGITRKWEAIDILADIVEELWIRVQPQIAESYHRARNSRPQDWGFPVDFILAIHSQWEAIERQQILDAFQTGIQRTSKEQNSFKPTFEFQIESTCSMASWLKNRTDGYDMKKPYLIVDMGGGTVDVTTNRVLQEEPLRVRQEIAGDGDYCGARLVNETFRESFQKTVDEDLPELMQKAGNKWPEIMRHLDAKFEELKKMFSPEPRLARSEYGLQLGVHLPVISRNFSASTDYRIANHTIFISHKEMEKCHSPSLKGINNLIRTQLKNYKEKAQEYPEAVILLGCFSQSAYIEDAIQKRFENIITIESPSSWKTCTVPTGACMIGGNLHFLESHIPMVSYGFAQDQLASNLDWQKDLPLPLFPLSQSQERNHAEDLPDDYLGKVIGPVDGKDYYKNRAVWMIRKNKRYAVNCSQSMKGRRFLFPVGQDTIKLTETLYMSRKTGVKFVGVFDPRYEVQRIAELEFEIHRPDRYGYKQIMGMDKQMVWDVDYSISMIKTGWRFEWEVVIPPGGDFRNHGSEAAKRRWGEYRSGKQVIDISPAFQPGHG